MSGKRTWAALALAVMGTVAGQAVRAEQPVFTYPPLAHQPLEDRWFVGPQLSYVFGYTTKFGSLANVSVDEYSAEGFGYGGVFGQNLAQGSSWLARINYFPDIKADVSDHDPLTDWRLKQQRWDAEAYYIMPLPLNIPNLTTSWDLGASFTVAHDDLKVTIPTESFSGKLKRDVYWYGFRPGVGADYVLGGKGSPFSIFGEFNAMLGGATVDREITTASSPQGSRRLHHSGTSDFAWGGAGTAGLRALFLDNAIDVRLGYRIEGMWGSDDRERDTMQTIFLQGTFSW